ncbi:hypothetical protein [Crocosphaera sp.]|uniref:hypothetical protein n=1 Tax=Crocosphaera sp. TaxID=2729996 RepID=UPI003F285131|nr:hypothetical protein [Crocosphaera sp.]
MVRLNQRSPLIKFLSSSLLIGLLSWGLLGCSDRLEASSPVREPAAVPVNTSQLTEVSPPTVIQELKEILAQYHPQVTIISPKPQQMFSETNVSVQLEVKDYPLFKDETLGLGPHLQLIVDNEPYRAVYNVDEPIILENLSPGTHTIRVFASRPWHESFKNEGAYAQRTFSVFTKTEDNSPSASLPLLTYSRPKGSYGAEPIMLDFYLTNAPLHFVAQSDPDDDIVDWRIKATINGESFLIDTWQPIYLNGFEPGKNWVQLEFIDEQGEEVNNAFNDTVRVINYEPKGEDTLSKLVRGELSVEVARSVVDPNYVYTLEPEPTEESLPPETVEEALDSEEVTETIEEAIDSEEVTETVEEVIEVEESASEPITSPTSQEMMEEESEAVDVASETLTEETETLEPSSEETVIEVTEPSQESVDTSSNIEPLEETETTIEVIESENIVNDDISVQDSSSVSEIIESETVNPSSEETPPAEKPQWLENFFDFFKKIDLSRVTDLIDQVKAKLGQ